MVDVGYMFVKMEYQVVGEKEAMLLLNCSEGEIS